MRLRFAIVGAGFTGTSMLYQFIRRLAIEAESGTVAPCRVHVRVFEKGSITGPGFPHNEHIVKPYHITNMCAQEMGVLYSRQEDFVNWIDTHRSELNTRFPSFWSAFRDPAFHLNACSHYPRALMGEYLKARFDGALRTAKCLGIPVEVHTKCEVTDITEDHQGNCVHVHASSAGATLRFTADRVLLATGHWPRGGSGGGYFASPWPAQTLIDEVPQGSRVAVIGSSLSAIEAVLTLTSDGRFVRKRSGRLGYIPSARPRQITLLSRHGLLPDVRCRAQKYRPRYFSPANLRNLLVKKSGFITLDEILNLLEQEIEWATQKAPNWRNLISPHESPIALLQSSLDQAWAGTGPNILGQAILRQAFPLVRELYLGLDIAERLRFDRDFATPFFAYAATQPPINAEKMLSLLSTGIVRLVKLGRTYRFNEKPTEPGFEFVYGERESERAEFRYFVDARGQERSVRSNDSVLYHNLIQNQTIHLGEIHPRQQAEPCVVEESSVLATDSVWIDPATHHVMQVDQHGKARKSKYLYAVGAMTRGQIIDVSMARGLTRSSDRVAEQLVDWLVKYPNSRGRNARYRAPPAQTRTCGFLASGSSVGLAVATGILFALISLQRPHGYVSQPLSARRFPIFPARL